MRHVVVGGTRIYRKASCVDTCHVGAGGFVADIFEPGRDLDATVRFVQIDVCDSNSLKRLALSPDDVL
jgi:hypothetical protein